MAPRVIHFCHNQIAWECKGFQDVEGHPHKDTTLRVRYGEITDEGRLKDLDAKHGIALRADRLKGRLARPWLVFPIYVKTSLGLRGKTEKIGR